MRDELGLVAGTELGGRYRLEALIGRGGMGEVWRGVDQRLRRPVAVKVLPAKLAAAREGVARFRREAETTAALQHPGITVVFDICEDDERLTYLVMELLDGEDLGAVLSRAPGGLPVAQAVGYAVQLAEALDAAHSHGIVHRDIKPANLFVVRGGRLKLCDFGIAGLADGTTRLTQDGTALGTPSYMAPEQFRGEQAAPSTDLYALGCVLHELLTGAPPFSSDAGLPGLLYQHLNVDPSPVRARRPDVPPQLEHLVLDLLAKPVERRPPSATAVAAFLRGEPPPGVPVPSLPPPLPRPLMPTVPHKSRKGLQLVVGAAVAVAVIAAVSTTTYALASNSRNQEEPVASPSTPVITPSTREPEIHRIVYKVTGSERKGSVSYSKPDGGYTHEQVDLPWTLKMDAQRFTSLTVSASTGLEGGAVTCRITVDGKDVVKNSGRGRMAFASCTYSPLLARYTSPLLP